MPPPARDHSADLDLIARVCGGDRAAWQRLVETYGADLRAAARRVLSSRGHAPPPHALEDLEADLWLGLVSDSFRRLTAYQGRCSLRQWLKVVASNHAIDTLRRQRPTLSLDAHTDPSDPNQSGLDLPSPDPDPLTQLEARRQADALRRALALLSDEDRLCIELYYQRGLPFERVAALMSITLGATYARKNRLRKRIIAALEADAPPADAPTPSAEGSAAQPLSSAAPQRVS
jgi:RNA polymerase sigma-70 factor (ECF subfamily)